MAWKIFVITIIVTFYACSLTESIMSTHITDRIYRRMLRYEYHYLNLKMNVYLVLINICLMWVYMAWKVFVIKILAPFYTCSLTECVMSAHSTERIYQRMLRYEHHHLNLKMTVYSVLINIYMMWVSNALESFCDNHNCSILCI